MDAQTGGTGAAVDKNSFHDAAFLGVSKLTCPF
jgi:hypothetical protein